MRRRIIHAIPTLLFLQRPPKRNPLCSSCIRRPSSRRRRQLEDEHGRGDVDGVADVRQAHVQLAIAHPVTVHAEHVQRPGVLPDLGADEGVAEGHDVLCEEGRKRVTSVPMAIYSGTKKEGREKKDIP